MVSVIIAVYNGEKYIKQAVDSVLNQTYKNIELIVVDDGSIDNTREVLSSCYSIKYVYQQNKGEGAARNLGVSLAKGEYIAFLDADDLYKADKIEKQVNILKSNPEIDIVYCDLDVVDENLNYINVLKSEGIYENRVDLLSMMLYRQVIQGPICMMIRKECANAVKWSENYTYIVDYIYTINLAKEFNFKYLEEPLYVYRRHNNNLSNSHARTLVEERDFLKSVGMNEIHKAINSSSFDLYNKKLLLVKILIKMQEYNKAQSILIELEEVRDDGYISFYLGNCFYEQNKFVEAAKFYEKSLEVNSNLAESYNNLGCSNIKLGSKLSEVKYNFSKALDIRNHYMDARVNLENVDKGNYDCKITEKELRKTLTIYK